MYFLITLSLITFIRLQNEKEAEYTLLFSIFVTFCLFLACHLACMGRDKLYLEHFFNKLNEKNLYLYFPKMYSPNMMTLDLGDSLQ